MPELLHPVAIVAMAGLTVWACYVIKRSYRDIHESVFGRRPMPRAKNTSQEYLRAMKEESR